MTADDAQNEKHDHILLAMFVKVKKIKKKRTWYETQKTQEKPEEKKDVQEQNQTQRSIFMIYGLKTKISTYKTQMKNTRNSRIKTKMRPSAKTRKSGQMNEEPDLKER
ncbi:hypothetical protein Zmor_013594 [Zophobas morio]|uniref:Uncharacterized protein n=1 Tax=Zophobas morio TaxID=2755281 RepID=A0AA38IIS4_9CUCU|nr:hypothetical protein Zmor_013594 [Zophobas morio]